MQYLGSSICQSWGPSGSRVSPIAKTAKARFGVWIPGDSSLKLFSCIQEPLLALGHSLTQQAASNLPFTSGISCHFSDKFWYSLLHNLFEIYLLTIQFLFH